VGGPFGTLRAPSVAAVLDRIYATAALEDDAAKARVRAREAEVGDRLSQAQRYELYGEAPQAITREVGELVYVLALGEADRCVVEFGASHGASTIYLAAALRDSGGGTVITGWQTVNAALADGVPLVCIPDGRDQPDNAARVVACGAGLRVRKNASPRKLRRVIAQALNDGALGYGAAKMADALAADGAVAVTERVEHFDATDPAGP
jgi:hypothetical protein